MYLQNNVYDTQKKIIAVCIFIKLNENSHSIAIEIMYNKNIIIKKIYMLKTLYCNISMKIIRKND